SHCLSDHARGEQPARGQLAPNSGDNGVRARISSPESSSPRSPPHRKHRMKTSKDRILTTHTGSLPRPKPLIDLVMSRERGETIDAAAFAAETARATDDIVAHQTAAGIDVVSDGEMSKPSYTTYIRHRVSGIAPDPRAAEKGRDIMIGRDQLAHPDFARQRGNFAGT